MNLRKHVLIRPALERHNVSYIISLGVDAEINGVTK